MACGCGGTDNGGGCSSAPATGPASPAPAAGGAPRQGAGEGQDWPRLRVNGVPIAPQALAQEVQYHAAASREEALYRAAQALVLRELLQQRIAALGLHVTATPGESAEEAAIRTLLTREVKVPEPDEASLARYFAANRERFCSPPLVAARHILLAAAPDDADARSEQRALALTLLAQLAAGADFAALAQAHSACPSRAQGGALGQISRGQTVPEFERQLLRLPVGLAPQPLASRYGWHVVEVQARVEGQALPFEAVRDTIRRVLSEQAWRRAVAQYLQVLVGEADIEGIALAGAATPLVQ